MLITAFIYHYLVRRIIIVRTFVLLGSIQDLAGMANHTKWKMSKRTVQYLERFRKILFWLLMLLMLTGVWSEWMNYELFIAFISSQLLG